jgi:hypothetical protein
MGPHARRRIRRSPVVVRRVCAMCLGEGKKDDPTPPCYAVPPHVKLTNEKLWSDFVEEVQWYYKFDMK